MAEQWSRCARHPEVETGLRCGKCATAICGRCLVHTPVGPRCPDCARPRRLPTFEVSPGYYLRASLAAFGAGLALGILYIVLAPIMVFLGLVGVAALAGIGYLVGEATSLAVNRKRSRRLQFQVAAATCLSYLLISYVGVDLFHSLYALAGMIVGVLLGTSRVR